jgi:hypothetical protein
VVAGTIDVESEKINAFSDRDTSLFAVCAEALQWLWLHLMRGFHPVAEIYGSPPYGTPKDYPGHEILRKRFEMMLPPGG